ncbi:MAG: site-2 protease family protein [Myxococcales bacterium]|nr:site-2 protease family protein [Myxococcales bacterium]
MLPRWRLGSLLGFPVYLNASFLALLAVAFLWLGGLGGVIVVGVVFASVLLHELGHAVVARRRGVAIGGIELSFLGGAAQMSQLPRSATDEIAIALAGPAVSLALAGLGLGLGALTGSGALATFGWINLVLAVFNLIPALPMDGGRVLRALLSFRADYVRATDQAVTVARVVAVGLGLLGLAGAVQLLILAPILWLMGSRERQLARAVAHQFVRTRRGYRERPRVIVPEPWFVAPRWRAL